MKWRKRKPLSDRIYRKVVRKNRHHIVREIRKMTLGKSILYLLPLLFIFTAPVSAQIVNIAPNLALEDSNGLKLELKTSVDTKSGNTESRSLTAEMAGRFRRDRDHLLFLNTGAYNSVNGAANDKAVMEHLRYRYDLRKSLASEVYVQHEYNKFRRLNVRALAGLGVRMILFRKQNLMLSCSPSCMIEYEKLDSAVDETGNPLLDSGLAKTNHRLSNNLVANWIINKRLQVVSSIYFQPRIDDLATSGF